MKKAQRALLYIVPCLGLIAIMWFVFSAGKALEASPETVAQPAMQANDQLRHTITESFHHPLAIFILQLLLIIVASQLCAFLFKKIGQPAVMGEIIAGILLGPSLMGSLLPAFSAFVFPPSSLGNLQMLSQVGLILFMFVIGMELDKATLKKKAGAAVFISYFSIIVPFGLGILLSYGLYKQYAPANIPFYALSLFIGIALSITAFPVLARIIRERSLQGTKLGVIAITAAAVGDVVAWCMLAFIVAIVKAGSVNSSIYTIAAAVIYTATMLYVVRPLLNKMIAKQGGAPVKKTVMAVIFVVLLLSAYCCEVIGIHALFGAFLAGAIMPADHQFREGFINKIEDVALVLLLPLFFVFTGLRTQVGLLNDPSLWVSCGIIILVAVAGKFGGSALAARIAGENAKESLSIGALMNTRGLVELVVLNIGYDLHILSPQIFTMMVLMALVTTFMTTPILNLINRIYK